MITRAVIPAAGLGARLCPITPFLPKELLPIEGLPIIHHALFELVESGINEVMVVLSKEKAALASYLTRAVHYKGESAERLCRARDEILSKIKIVFAEQKRLCGTADAVYLAKDFMQDEPILVLYPDDLLSVQGRLSDGIEATRKMMTVAEKTGCCVLLSEEIDGKKASDYGVLSVRESDKDLLIVDGIVEKPGHFVEKRAHVLIGRMVLTPKAIHAISLFDRTDAAGIIPLLDREGRQGRLLAIDHHGKRFDVGSHEGYQRVLRELSY